MMFGVVLLAATMFYALVLAVPAALIVRKAGFGKVVTCCAFLVVLLTLLSPVIAGALVTYVYKRPPGSELAIVGYAGPVACVMGLWLFALCKWPALKR